MLYSFWIHLRLKEDATAREALLIAEKQENEVIKRTLTEALDQIEELVKEVECANHRVQQLQDSIQRSVHGNIAVILEPYRVLIFFTVFVSMNVDFNKVQLQERQHY